MVLLEECLLKQRGVGMIGLRAWRSVRIAMRAPRTQLMPAEKEFLCASLAKYSFGTLAFEMAPKRNQEESTDESASLPSDEVETKPFVGK